MEEYEVIRIPVSDGTEKEFAIMINIYRNIRSIQVNKLDEMKW